MNLDEYKKQLSELELSHNQARFELAREYAMANNPVKKGDFVTSCIETIKVDRIGVYMDSTPSCVYEGFLYTKKMGPHRSGGRGIVHQTNMQKHVKAGAK